MNQAKGHGEKRSRKQEQFIAALLSYPTVEAAAKVVGIGNVTAWKWRKDPAFDKQYREATREAMHQAAALLQGAAREAVETLRAILSKAESEAARVSAARTILDMALKAAELEDIEQRLSALEQAAEERRTR
jgi:nicotinic acid phosphoribosyltransferase